MAEIVDYRRLKHAAPGLLPSLARAQARRRARDRWLTLWLAAFAFLASAAVASLLLGNIDLPGVTAARAPADLAPALTASFPICRGSVRLTCVVDGDTFWLDGTKYRIADIDTPEVSSPACAAEKAMGLRATQRLADLLNAGPFQLGAADRDADRYGRKLRIVTRDGASLGGLLVAEGLAHRWDGRKHPWC